MKRGYIKLNRKIEESWLWDDEPFSKGQAWIDLLLLANHKDYKTQYRGNVILRKRGEVNRSVSFLAERWKWSRFKVKKFLTTLENEEMVQTTVTKRDTVIFIRNYERYQSFDGEFAENYTSEKPSDSNGSDGVSEEKPTSDLATDFTSDFTSDLATDFTSDFTSDLATNKNAKECKRMLKNGNKKKTSKESLRSLYAPFPEEMHEHLEAFMDMRLKGKNAKEFTERAFKMILKKLTELSGGDSETANRILDQSTRNGWRDVYPLKEEKTRNSFMDIDF